MKAIVDYGNHRQACRSWRVYAGNLILSGNLTMEIEKLQGEGWLFDADRRLVKVKYAIVVTQYDQTDVLTRVTSTRL